MLESPFGKRDVIVKIKPLRRFGRRIRHKSHDCLWLTGNRCDVAHRSSVRLQTDQRIKALVLGKQYRRIQLFKDFGALGIHTLEAAFGTFLFGRFGGGFRIIAGLVAGEGGDGNQAARGGLTVPPASMQAFSASYASRSCFP